MSAASPGTATGLTAGAALLTRLGRLGVDYVFANSGTDFPPIIEGLADATHKGLELPETVIVPFESAAVAMAHGYTLATGRPQAVMVHTNVGLANATLGAINAACDRIPMILMSGRTPSLEKGRFGARTVPIGWGQEMKDQTALVREACKWDYELRFPEQVFDVVDRAHGIATSSPTGPVYVSLPREVLCESVPAAGAEARPQMRGAAIAAPAEEIERAARLLAEAERPVIFAQRGAGSSEAFAALADLATDWGVPVCQYWATRLAIASDHPMAAGPDPAPLLGSADVILVIDSLAPWSPDLAEPRPECQVIQLGPDPLQANFPVRNFRSDLSLAGETAATLLALKHALDGLLPEDRSAIELRRQEVAARNATDRAVRQAEAGRAATRLTKVGVSGILSAGLEGREATVFGELGCQLPFMTLGHHDAWFDGPHAGGLGWGLPAAMGYKLATPDRPVVATVGDGSYIFANPVACHQIAEALGISVVVLVLNNEEWGAVRQSVLGLYPDGFAAKANKVPLTSLAPSPDFVQVAKASRAWARRVATAEELENALRAALDHCDAGKGLALIEVAIDP